MLYYDEGKEKVDIAIGKDAGYYHPECADLEWSDDIQPFGYAGVRQFFTSCSRKLEEER